MASKLSNLIRIVSFNVRGFQSGQSFVSELLYQCELLCLQEHWLLDQHLSTMNFCEEFIMTCVSGMEPDSLIRGRPFGGCAIFYRKNFSSKISICHVSSSAVRLKISDNETLLLVCVYLPSDTGLSSEYQEALGELEGFLDSQVYDSLAIVGDFNIDFSHSARQRSSDQCFFSGPLGGRGGGGIFPQTLTTLSSQLDVFHIFSPHKSNFPP